jgi:hypothetical protein
VDGLPGVEGPDGYDADGDDGGGSAEDANVRLDLLDAGDDLGLLALSIGVNVGEEEALLLVAGELTAVGQDGDEAGGDGGPDNEHGRNGVDCGFDVHVVSSPLGQSYQSMGSRGPARIVRGAYPTTLGDTHKEKAKVSHFEKRIPLDEEKTYDHLGVCPF